MRGNMMQGVPLTQMVAPKRTFFMEMKRAAH